MLPSAAWHGYFDITLEAKLHWHGIILHEGMSRDELARILREVFPERNAVHVYLDPEQSVIENMERWIADRRSGRAGRSVPPSNSV